MSGQIHKNWVSGEIIDVWINTTLLLTVKTDTQLRIALHVSSTLDNECFNLVPKVGIL